MQHRRYQDHRLFTFLQWLNDVSQLADQDDRIHQARVLEKEMQIFENKNRRVARLLDIFQRTEWSRRIRINLRGAHGIDRDDPFGYRPDQEPLLSLDSDIAQHRLYPPLLPGKHID